MNYKATTMIPNSILDTYLRELSGAELKILLIITRQTLGWVDSKGHRKLRDWITQKLFVKKTGLSRKTVAMAIQSLIKKRLIITSYNEGVEIPHPKNSLRTYYSLHPQLWSKNDTAREKKVLPTKLTVHKTKPEPRRLTDRERLLEILQLGDQYSKGSLSTSENLESP